MVEWVLYIEISPFSILFRVISLPYQKCVICCSQHLIILVCWKYETNLNLRKLSLALFIEPKIASFILSKSNQGPLTSTWPKSPHTHHSLPSWPLCTSSGLFCPILPSPPIRWIQSVATLQTAVKLLSGPRLWVPMGHLQLVIHRELVGKKRIEGLGLPRVARDMLS